MADYSTQDEALFRAALVFDPFAVSVTAEGSRVGCWESNQRQRPHTGNGVALEIWYADENYLDAALARISDPIELQIAAAEFGV